MPKDASKTVLQPQGDAGKKRRSMGCGVGCLLAIAGLLFMGWMGYRMIGRIYQRWMDEFQEQGFVKVEVADGVVTESAPGKHLYVAPLGAELNLWADCDSDVAIMAARAVIHSRVAGDVYFRGNVLELAAGAEVTGDVNAVAREVIIRGTLGGEILGEVTHQIIDQRRTTAAPQAAPDMAETPAEQ